MYQLEGCQSGALVVGAGLRAVATCQVASGKNGTYHTFRKNDMVYIVFVIKTHKSMKYNEIQRKLQSRNNYSAMPTLGGIDDKLFCINDLPLHRLIITSQMLTDINL